MMKIILVFICFLSSTLNFYGQSLKKHEWKNRVLLIVSSEKNNQLLSQQIEILKKESNGLQERKLVVYSIFKTYYTYNFQSKKQKSTDLYHQFNPKNQKFKIVIIGLDGGVKLNQTDFLSVEKLFTLIDGMPMRRYEIKSKN